MLNIKGITEQKAEKIYEAASKIETMSFQSGMVIFEKRKKIKRITTGSRQFDMLLCKYFHSPSVYCKYNRRRS